MKKARIDKLGRIVIPISYRRKFKIDTNTDLIIDCDSRSISILPIVNVCKICERDICEKREISLCDECISKIKKYEG